MEYKHFWELIKIEKEISNPDEISGLMKFESTHNFEPFKKYSDYAYLICRECGEVKKVEIKLEENKEDVEELKKALDK